MMPSSSAFASTLPRNVSRLVGPMPQTRAGNAATLPSETRTRCRARARRCRWHGNPGCHDVHDALTRTTLELDDSVLAAAHSLARARGTSLGETVSELVRRGLASGTTTTADFSYSPFPVMVGDGPR